PRRNWSKCSRVSRRRRRSSSVAYWSLPGSTPSPSPSMPTRTCSRLVEFQSWSGQSRPMKPEERLKNHGPKAPRRAKTKTVSGSIRGRKKNLVKSPRLNPDQLPVQIESDGAVEVSTISPDVKSFQAGQYLRAWVLERIVHSYRNYGEMRMNGVEQFRRAGSSTAVVRDF